MFFHIMLYHTNCFMNSSCSRHTAMLYNLMYRLSHSPFRGVPPLAPSRILNSRLLTQGLSASTRCSPQGQMNSPHDLRRHAPAHRQTCVLESASPIHAALSASLSEPRGWASLSAAPGPLHVRVLNSWPRPDPACCEAPADRHERERVRLNLGRGDQLSNEGKASYPDTSVLVV